MRKKTKLSSCSSNEDLFLCPTFKPQTPNRKRKRRKA
ncbi:BnaC06g04060D [Brassica napus]|uniref:BnaC06g04060D protein n=2 Tax=Brassica TaxID=3705 RepID=A0A078GIH8_BRANA|nr:BnaC06g04060D [Brassica napus]VDD60271.1 unnamed protein product [Brassica oleracea]